MASMLDERVLAHKPLKAETTPAPVSIPIAVSVSASASVSVSVSIPVSASASTSTSTSKSTSTSTPTPPSQEIHHDEHYDMLIANSSHMSLSALESGKSTFKNSKTRGDSSLVCRVEMESVEVEKCLSDIDIDDSMQSKQRRALRITTLTEQEPLTTTLPREKVENRPSSISDFFNPQACVMHKKFGGMRRNWTFLSLNGMVEDDCDENDNEDGSGSSDKKVIMQERKRARIASAQDDQQ
eukprot:CAMPEP_0184692266 /NCGR_PEP_ID=MMETSP0313-20130426/825_1 /TAXON_ID=2792 /ORGANISM="Porphyridium aerugineum, Strain SAG 1380-2" /LENGTH=239 /DNA_ID=CAMNT_0027150091 /DNA_START=483 /DNA_END=1202 /DNA_ORIENTATION=+